MKSKRKSSISQATSDVEMGEFWDTHSAADYWHLTKPVEFKINLKRKPKTVELDPKVYEQLSKQARKKRTTLSKLVNRLLAEKVATP